MIQICEGLKHLHSLNILHRDFKIENVFVNEKEKGKYQMKIGDFGYSKVFDKEFNEPLFPKLIS
jgi:serine/threonine protein kinase